jgi:surface carbohydrate biosynthesis protein
MAVSLKPQLIIPVENQVRELDPKLLLACVAANRGFVSVIGFRREIHFNIASFPAGIYVSKSMTDASDSMFKIMRKLGCQVVAWDEEALVHLPPEIYYSRRLSPVAVKMVSHFFAWGQDSADLWQNYRHFPSTTPIHVTGNPRCDLLRPDIRCYYDEEAGKIHDQYGDFLLVNTNFNHVNAFSSVQNLFRPMTKKDREPKFGRAAFGMTREYAQGLHRLKQGVFGAFQKMIPELEQAFPNFNIVVRPHPTENPEVYQRIAASCSRVRVTNSGNIVPWLMATRSVIHNGCTTGLEATIMGVPAVSYRAVVDTDYDYGFYRLPNLASHECFSMKELLHFLHDILEDRLGAANGDDRRRLIDHHVASCTGPLACERIVDVLETMTPHSDEESAFDRLHGEAWAIGRTLIKRAKAQLPGSHNKPEFQRHRYPEISIEDVQARARRFQRVLGHSNDLKVRLIQQQFFEISA